MKLLIVPENNSLSHIGKALALEAELGARGHEVHVAVAEHRIAQVQHLGERCHVLPDLQESDHAAYPTAAWFHEPERLEACIRAEVELLNRLRPDRCLGVFRFTLKASSRLAGVPFDSLACGCMLPESPDVLGFAESDEGIGHERYMLDMFFRFAADRASRGLESFGLPRVSDIRELLKGDRTFLWDFPEFAPLKGNLRPFYIGPIAWNEWPHDSIDLEPLFSDPRPLAVLSFGTCIGSAEVAARMAHILLGQGYQVLVAAGGQEALLRSLADEPGITACRFAPLHLIFRHASLLVCHGGQLSVFEALSHRVPVAVMPFQPEQAHNGVCLERIGCGCRLIPARHYLGRPHVYVDAFMAMTDQEIAEKIRNLTESSATPERLAAFQETLGRYGGCKAMATMLVEN